jgi:gamma-glutamylcyclotransferase (GGCT)/AIG2-like uncharacterized protein YtfP
MKYIAYGSNMAASQMARRCPDAKLIGAGYIEDARLEFYLHATIEPSQIKEDRVPVAVWEISKADEQQLDLYEGHPHYYIKKMIPVRMADGSEIKGMVYIMRLIRTAQPSASYYDSIANAYKRLGFGCEIKAILEPAYRRSFMRS